MKELISMQELLKLTKNTHTYMYDELENLNILSDQEISQIQGYLEKGTGEWSEWDVILVILNLKYKILQLEEKLNGK